jgi:hypothetical protein
MPTTGPDAVLTLYRALTDGEREEAFERICQLRVADAAEGESDMARYLRSLARVTELVGRTPTVTDYKDAQAQLAAAGDPIEPFSRIYAFFDGVWARAREALELSETTTPRRIEARFRSRQLGKVWRYTDDTLRDALLRAAEHWGRPPSVAEFEWWRENELRLAQATGDGEMQLPTSSPYRKRWVTWEAALLAHGFQPEEVALRLEGKAVPPKNPPADPYVPAGLPVAELGAMDGTSLPLSPEQLDRLRVAWAELPRRTRYLLTARLGLGTAPLSHMDAGRPVGLGAPRACQLALEALDALTSAVAGGSLEDRDAAGLRQAVEATLGQLAR